VKALAEKERIVFSVNSTKKARSEEFLSACLLFNCAPSITPLLWRGSRFSASSGCNWKGDASAAKRRRRDSNKRGRLVVRRRVRGRALRLLEQLVSKMHVLDQVFTRCLAVFVGDSDSDHSKTFWKYSHELAHVIE
jgi:hypothetical protein